MKPIITKEDTGHQQPVSSYMFKFQAISMHFDRNEPISQMSLLTFYARMKRNTARTTHNE